MEEGLITSDLNDTGSIPDNQSDIGSRRGSSRAFPKRIVTDVDEDTMDNTEEEEGEESEDDFEDGGSNDDDDDYNPSNVARKSKRIQEKVKESVPLHLRRDNMTVEEVAEEELRLQAERNKRLQLARETRSNAKGDTKVTFFSTHRGGRYKESDCKVVLFRGYIFQASRKGNNGKYYWRCPIRSCHCALTLLNEKFCSTTGEHDHPSTADEVLGAIERRKKKKERELQAREKRLQALKQKEIERRNNAVNGIVVEEPTLKSVRSGNGMKDCIKNIWGGDKPPKAPVGLLPPKRDKRKAIEGLDELDVDEIDQLPTNLNFDMDFFNEFCDKMDKLFCEMTSYGLCQEQIRKDWDTIKKQVKSVAKARIKIKDQRYRAMRVKLDKATVERDVAVETKRILDSKITGLNVAGAELLINQIKELQGKDSVFQIVNGEVVQKDVEEYKMKYEKAVKERDALKLKLKNLAAAASSSLALFGMDIGGDDDDCNKETSERTPSTSTVATSIHTMSTPSSSRSQPTSHVSATSIQAVHPNHNQQTSNLTHHSHQPHHLSMPTIPYSQTMQQAALTASFNHGHGWQVM